MTTAATLWDRYGWIDAIRRSSRKDTQQMLLICFCTDNILSRWTPRYLTDVLKGTLFLPMFAHSLSTNSRQDAEPTGITSVLSVFNLSLLLFIQREQNIINTCLNTGLNRKELIGWGHFWTAQYHRRTCDSHYLWVKQSTHTAFTAVWVKQLTHTELTAVFGLNSQHTQSSHLSLD